eukprot:m.51050 g.51050  ORF g.51050 m.51050 type:complete len:1124 (-) comp15377_c1_seq21:3150-6521(-)
MQNEVDDTDDPMAAVLRNKLENGSITQSEYEHLRSVHQQGLEESSRGVYEFSAADLAKLNPEDARRVMEAVKTGRLTIEQALAAVKGRSTGSAVPVSKAQHTLAPVMFNRMASFTIPPPPPPASATEESPVVSATAPAGPATEEGSVVLSRTASIEPKAGTCAAHRADVECGPGVQTEEEGGEPSTGAATPQRTGTNTSATPTGTNTTATPATTIALTATRDAGGGDGTPAAQVIVLPGSEATNPATPHTPSSPSRPGAGTSVHTQSPGGSAQRRRRRRQLPPPPPGTQGSSNARAGPPRSTEQRMSPTATTLALNAPVAVAKAGANTVSDTGVNGGDEAARSSILPVVKASADGATLPHLADGQDAPIAERAAAEAGDNDDADPPRKSDDESTPEMIPPKSSDDDGNIKIVPPKGSRLQQRKRKPTSSGDSSGKTDYSIKQRDARAKQVAQRLAVYADDIAEWLSELLEIKDPELTGPTLMTALEDGVVLCRLAHTIHAAIDVWKYPTAVSPTAVHPPKYRANVRGGFQARDNVAGFVQWATALGCPCLFESEDLVLHRSDMAVLYCLMDVARGAVRCVSVIPHLVQFEQDIDATDDAAETAAMLADAADMEEDFGDSTDDDDASTTASAIVARASASDVSDAERQRMQEEAERFAAEQAEQLRLERAMEEARRLAAEEQARAVREERERLAALEHERQVQAEMAALREQQRIDEEQARERARLEALRLAHELAEREAAEQAYRAEQERQRAEAERLRQEQEQQRLAAEEAARQEQLAEFARQLQRAHEAEEKARLQRQQEAEEAARRKAQHEAELAEAERLRVQKEEALRQAAEQQRLEEERRLAEAAEAQRRAEEERQLQEERERQMRDMQERVAEAARRKAEKEQRAREEAERARQREQEAAEAKRVADEAAAKRARELAALKEAEANNVWLQEALRLEKEAADKRKRKAKAALKVGVDTIVPQALQAKMADIGIKPQGRGKYWLGKQLLSVRIYKDHIVVRVGGGWDTLENYLFNHYKTRPGLEGHVLRRDPDGSGVPRWEKAPQMSEYVEELEAVTEEAVQHVSHQMQEQGRAKDNVDIENEVVIAGPSKSLNKIGGFAERPSLVNKKIAKSKSRKV